MTSVVSISPAQLHATVSIDLDGRIVGWSSGAHALLGHRAPAVLGQSVEQLFGPLVAQDLARALEGHDTRSSRVLQRADGSELHVDLHLTRLVSLTGEPERVVLIARDSSAQRQLEAEVLRQTELEQYLIGVVGHDLRNPLHAVMLTASHALQHPVDARMRRSLERIRTSAERGVRLTYDLLDFNRVRRGHGIPVELREVDLHSLAREEIAEAVHLRSERNIHLDTRGPLKGRWDADRVRQLLQNLLNNALQHTTEDVPVRLDLEGASDHVRLTVHNGGPPISADLRSRLFLPYVASHGGVSGGRSVGLGLFIARAIARAHGGTLEVQSDAEHGTSFTAVLPRSPSDTA